MSTDVTLIGRLGQDPDLSFTPSGKAVAKLSVVTSRGVKQEDGTWQDVDVTWWNVSAWDRLGENCAEYLHKGDAVIVKGKASTRSYDRTDGSKGMSLDVVAWDIGPNLRWTTPNAVQRSGAVPQQGGTPARGLPQSDDPWATSAPPASAQNVDPWATRTDGAPPF
jgi:single-strand DNA-binding protein